MPEFVATGHAGGHRGADPKMPHSMPVMGGAAGFGYITVGGMLTVLKVRDQLTDHSDPGWCVHADGSVARAATAAELDHDGIRKEGW